MSIESDARRAIERAACESYGRLLAFLAARSRDVAAAEDALAEAFRSALETWPHTKVPDKPEGWLLTVARRRLIDRDRNARTHADALPTLLGLTEEAHELVNSGVEFPDERLKLMFICAHPAIDASARTPLMLQTVLGLDAARIASAFIVQPATMGQRLSRAKTKIRDAGIAFELPEAADLPSRLDAVLDAIYAAYGSGWDDVSGGDARRKGLSAEAISIGRLLVQLMPDEPEASGLVALMLFCESRRESRRSPRGSYIPLSDQDVARWSTAMMKEAESHLRLAAQAGAIGRFQIEAAIQSLHAQRAITGRTDWDAIAVMYEGLARISPTIGVLVSRAAAVSRARDAITAWTSLQTLPAEATKSYQPYWALAAHLLGCLRRTDEARAAYSRAIGLCEDPAMREYLDAQMRRLP
jgi:predicted RNA polymerase sigma factor